MDHMPPAVMYAVCFCWCSVGVLALAFAAHIVAGIYRRW